MLEEKDTKSELLNFEPFKNKIFFKNGIKKVHYTLNDLKIKGNLYRNDLIWYEGLQDWTKVIDIPELSSLALSQPPLTRKEKNILRLKKALKPSIIVYVFFSIFIGISSALIEEEQYNYFVYKINKNIQNLKDEGLYNIGSNNSYAGNSFESYSEMRPSEIYVTEDNGKKFTRWKSFVANREADQEQVSYESHHKFLFRPYKAIIGHANLSIEERGNIGLLLTNFTLSAFVTNLIILPFLILVYFLKNRKRI